MTSPTPGNAWQREPRPQVVWILFFVLAARQKPRADFLNRPMHHGVGGVVQHLTDDFTTNPRVGASFYFHESWNGAIGLLLVGDDTLFPRL